MKLMDKKNIVIVFIAAAGIFLLTCVFLYIRANNLKKNLTQSEQMVKKLLEDAKRLETEKKKAVAENEKLQADSISYIGVNSQLQSEKEKLQASFDEAKKDLGKKQEELEKIKMMLASYEKKVNKEKNEEQERLAKEIEELKKKAKDAEDSLKKEKALFNYNLAVAYTKSSLYDEAVEAYEKSLEVDPNNAEAHYNLGLLLEKVKQNPQQALEHYRKYLELNPEADDKDEVSGWIGKLEAAN